jgi:hypothetical protein
MGKTGSTPQPYLALAVFYLLANGRENPGTFAGHRVAASRRAQCPEGERYDGEDARAEKRDSDITHRDVGGCCSSVDEDRASVGPFLEPGKRGTSRATAPGTFQTPMMTEK